MLGGCHVQCFVLLFFRKLLEQPQNLYLVVEVVLDTLSVLFLFSLKNSHQPMNTSHLEELFVELFLLQVLLKVVQKSLEGGRALLDFYQLILHLGDCW